MKESFLLGNGAIALGLLQAGCQVVTSYPGTPSSEILPEVVRLKKEENIEVYTQWSTNEKVAFDNAYAAAISGKRAACCMKQVGLNVAADSLMSSAYTGTTGALVIISCDDPGPHSSQTEQDTRLMARLAKVPVLDPESPEQAREMASFAIELSEEFKIPVILRPGIRVCHARQNIKWEKLENNNKKAEFIKNPGRWAATPKFRLILHRELNNKLKMISKRFSELPSFNSHNLKPGMKYKLGIVTAGAAAAAVSDIIEEHKRDDIPVLKLGAPYPFPQDFVDSFVKACDKVLVIEETDTLIEYLLQDKNSTIGRLSGHVPSEGELVPDIIEKIIDKSLKTNNLKPLSIEENDALILKELELPVRKPTLCPGCPHRAAFFAIRKSRPKAIFTSDIGCYTLGLNLGAVDTCLDMGAGITMASGFYHSFSLDQVSQPIIATMGDSTFFHSGTAGLINAVYNDARFILVILDNRITAMTGMQPSISSGILADQSMGNSIELERVIAGCGVDFIEVIDPYDVKGLLKLLKKAVEYVEDPKGGIAAIIARHPCPVAFQTDAPKIRVAVTEDCDGCNLCQNRFGCPGLKYNENSEKNQIDYSLCKGCGVCLSICPKGAIVKVQGEKIK